ncbi:MAG: hypothetical protein AAF732_18035 [Pseudomonadota bacterium]
MTSEQRRECERLAVEFRKIESRLAENRGKLIEADEAVQLAQGRLTEAEDLLEHIIDQIATNVQSGIACAQGLRRGRVKRDCIELGVNLTRLKADREQKLRYRRDELEKAKLARQAAQDKVDFARNDLDRLRSAVERGGCLSFLQ